MLYEIGVERGINLDRVLVARAALTETPHRPVGSHTSSAGPVARSAR